jgi:LysR family hydrogen peroxide-inducible transcriptional activator
VSQPSLSQQIIGLETALRLDLVERGQRGAVLTPGGAREVLAQARKVLEEAASLRRLAEDTREGVSGTIRLGSTPTLGPCVLRQLYRTYPSLKVIVRDALAVELQEAL